MKFNLITVILIKLQFRHSNSYFISHLFIMIQFISGNMSKIKLKKHVNFFKNYVKNKKESGKSKIKLTSLKSERLKTYLYV